MTISHRGVRRFVPRPVKIIARGPYRAVNNILSAGRRMLWRWQSRSAIEAYLRTTDIARLHLGCGPNAIKGWLDTDLRPRNARQVFLDLTQPFPFPDASFSYVLGEHVIGDLTFRQCEAMVSECHRVLRPGGRIRISTPNLQAVAALYSESPTPAQRHYMQWATTEYIPERAPLPGFVLNNLVHEYRFVYDVDTLRLLVEDAGFVDFRRFCPGESDDPELQQLEQHGKVLKDTAVNAFESLVVEGTRPLK